ncbi:ABC transporter ATP-binding protein [Ramlibacter henchirensis]|uniref:ABC transporter ATP-binding protein n=1 Tax=Ramlibacter henchirensis TaxID=204072 RepID=A0A4Z0BXW5_9BURK|nr:ABC transporter ATP-binding protein [Ramlibacter henchirensis]TFZ02769.1 ABC transporter ATP-binding protein [Ramlibacter henchirensis]
MSTLSLQSLEKRYGAAPAAVDKVSLEVGQSEFVALLGPSGCGKTTILRMIAGFVEPTSGRILVDGRDVTRAPPHKRNTAMVFQSYALFPHMTVAQNVGFGLRMRRADPAEIDRRSVEALRLVQLEHLAQRYPRELSGGQQQRVAVARALIVRPDVFLLDEPLSNLDAKLRQSVGLEMRTLQQSLGLTTVFVTHDQAEALALADRLVILSEGKVAQVGSPAEVYSKPANAFVANFLGRANLLGGRIAGDREFQSDAGISIACDTSGWSAGERAILCLRPENIVIGERSAQVRNTFTAVRRSRTYQGASTEHVVQLPSGLELSVSAPSGIDETNPVFDATGNCRIGWAPESVRLLPEH